MASKSVRFKDESEGLKEVPARQRLACVGLFLTYLKFQFHGEADFIETSSFILDGSVHLKTTVILYR